MNMERKEFESIASALRGRIVATALGITRSEAEAEDVAQETLLKLWSMREKLDNYRSIESLAVVIARNRCIDLARRASQIQSLPADSLDISDTSLSPEHGKSMDESRNETDHILSLLPESQRIVLQMKHVDGLEVSEIARLTGSNENAIRVTLSRARHRVKQIFMTMQ